MSCIVGLFYLFPSVCLLFSLFSVLSIFASFIRLSVIRNVNVYNVIAKRHIKLVLKYNVLLCLL